MLRKVLIANRGEIAVRIAQAVQEMGSAAIAIYAEPDRISRHVLAADEAYPLPGDSTAETYLNQDEILRIARACGADAIHPGYGFLSENAAFARAVAGAGLLFVGPPAGAIAALGDKVRAKQLAQSLGVPVIPGWSGGASLPADVHGAASELGYPLIVKAAAGGGGKGMRLVAEPAGLDAAVESARREAESAFGDGRIFLERWLARPRHVEVQVIADVHGTAVHLFERECSIQRRHQKIVEESPSPALDCELRARMGEAAIRLSLAAGYRNAGTVEFLLDEQRSFYFLEVNTRLQVEHPVTEMVTGIDLVGAQLLVAAGEPLPFRQEMVIQSGHAIECRIYAEDPANGFLPDTGTLAVYREPAGAGIRVDSGVREGDEVTAGYDPLLAKLIVRAETRAGALARLEWALSRFVILGVRTNLSFLLRLIRDASFAAGDLSTRFLEEHPPLVPPAPPPEALAVAALALSEEGERNQPTTGRLRPRSTTISPWRQAGGWRLRT